MTATLNVSLKAIAENYTLLKTKAAPAECAVVVKADGYGLGLEPIARVLWKAGARFFYVALLEEAIALRGLLPSAQIAVLNGIDHANRKERDYYQLISVMNHHGNLPGILHIDTGMNRLGFSVKEAEKLPGGLPDGRIMSHLACADTSEHPMNEEQFKQFDHIRKSFPAAKASLANSSGIFLGKKFHFHQVRPGCALYGINPTPNKKNPMQPVITLTAPILQIRHVDENDTVGYGATAKVKKGARLATIGLGYADGLLRSIEGKGEVIIAGKPAKLLGRVSMDLVVADISHLPEGKYTEAEIIGQKFDANHLAQAANTIGYEVLTRLGARFKQNYQ